MSATIGLRHAAYEVAGRVVCAVAAAARAASKAAVAGWSARLAVGGGIDVSLRTVQLAGDDALGSVRAER